MREFVYFVRDAGLYLWQQPLISLVEVLTLVGFIGLVNLLVLMIAEAIQWQP